MIKKLMALGLMGMGFVVAQGCAVEQGSSEETGVAADAVVNAACYTNSGLKPTKAALAIAMADELGRWAPEKDLVAASRPASMPTNTQPVVQLSSTAVCLKNNCKNTKAILGQQDWRLYTIIDQNVFNATNFNGDLVQSLGRQAQKITDLTRNNKSQLPPVHKLTKVAGPLDLGVGACGPHYVFQADHADGTPLSTTEANNLSNALCMFDYGSCGSNPYIKYTVTGQGCPTGRTCVAVDPSDGDNAASTTTTAGASNPVYPMNRVYDDTNALLGTGCTTTGGKVTTLISKCSIMPDTCNYLYCK